MLSYVDIIPPKRTSTSAAPAMTQAAIRKLVADSVAAALEHKLQQWQTPNLLGLLKMEDEFYNLTLKGSDLKTYIRRFQELATLCPTMVPNSKKLIEVFIGGLTQSIEGNDTASKPQTLKEAINIAQRLMVQVTKHNFVQETNDHKRKFDDRRNTTNDNNYYNNRNNNHNNDHHQQQNRRHETFRAYAATPTENRSSSGLDIVTSVTIFCNERDTGLCYPGHSSKSKVEHGFLSQKGVGVGGRGVKDKQHGSASNTVKGTSVAFSTVDEHVKTPSVNLEKPLELNMGYHINDTANVEGPTISNLTPITSASISESNYFAAILKGDMTRKSVNFCTLATLVGNGVDAAISLESIRATSEWFANTSYGFFLRKRKAYPVFSNYARNTWSKYELVKSMMNSSNRSSYVRAMIELRADEELKDTIMEAMPKLAGEGFSLCTRRVAYEWKPPRCLSCKVFGHVLQHHSAEGF
ncbi:hypothetical protein Tco_0053272 [Tanacetum coccineum]